MNIKDRKIEFVITFILVFLVGFVCSGVLNRNLPVSIGLGLLLATINGIILYIRQNWIGYY